MKNFNKVFTIIVLLFLYIPMIVLAVGSFNSGMDIAVFKGFTLDNYSELFRDSVLLPLLLKKKMNSMLSWLKLAQTKLTLLKKSVLSPSWA